MDRRRSARLPARMEVRTITAGYRPDGTSTVSCWNPEDDRIPIGQYSDTSRRVASANRAPVAPVTLVFVAFDQCRANTRVEPFAPNAITS
jgi:hypothetical protein